MRVFCELMIVPKSVGNFIHIVFSLTEAFLSPMPNDCFENVSAH